MRYFILALLLMAPMSVQAQEAAVQEEPQGNKGYIIGEAPAEPAAEVEEKKLCTLKEFVGKAKTINVVKGVNNLDKWIQKNMW